MSRFVEEYNKVARNKFKKITKKRWFFPAVIIAFLLIMFLGTGTVILVQNHIKEGSSTQLKTASESSDVSTPYNISGVTGTLYSMDESSDSSSQPYGSNEVLESGYDTASLNTGTASRLQELQEQIDDLEKKTGANDTGTIQNDMRSKVDYNTLNSTVTDATDSLSRTLNNYETANSTDHSTLRTIIASNKSDADSKIKSLENALSSNTNKDAALTTTVKDNYNTTQKQISELQKSTSSTKSSLESSISSLQSSTNTKISNLKEATETKLAALEDSINSSLSSNVTNISSTITNIQNGSTAVLIGTYDSSSNKFTIKGGTSN